MTESVFLSWADVAKALRWHLCAKYQWPEGSFFELTPKADGVLIQHVEIDENKPPPEG